ncbi:MAG: 1,4-alpha-glucan branching protein domain-containing protein [bacterium]
MNDGARLAIVLHAHLPYVRHPGRDDVLEEAWLVQALVDCYLPLLERIEGWVRDRVPFALALSVSPTLIAMLDDPLLRRRSEERIAAALAVVERELVSPHRAAELSAPLAHHREHLVRVAARNRALGGDVLGAFAALARGAPLELFTTAATHAFLPNLAGLDAAMRAQLCTGIACHARRFGAPPLGLWLPECGFVEALDPLLAELGIRWSVVDAHALATADPPALFGPYAPVCTPGGVAMFGRDPESSDAVWSAESGYPGHPLYREFHRDLGQSCDLRPHLPALDESGRGWPTGIKLHAVTDRGSDRKRAYDPDAAAHQACADARDFLAGRVARANALAPVLHRAPLFVAPFDAELFGHWWFEGPIFLDALVREAAQRDDVTLVTPSAELAARPRLQEAMPSASSWGAGGYRESWLDPRNAWVVREVREVAEQMTRLARDFAAERSELGRRALAQAGREALLAMASDWSFILRAGTVSGYAEARIREHLARFRSLAHELRANAIDVQRLAAIEAEDGFVADLDPGWFA